MNNILQMILSQAPQTMMSQLEQQLKRVNPQAYQQFQSARKNNEDPNKLLSDITNNFNPQQKQRWDAMMSQLTNHKQG